MRKWLICAAIVMFAVSSRADVSIIKEGKSDYVITTMPGAGEGEKLAAIELQKYLEQMTGVKLPLQQGASTSHAINICDKTKLIASKVEGDAYEISVDGNGQVLIVGGNQWAVLHGVYAFLDSQGCRFLSPQFNFYGGKAEVIPHVSELDVKAMTSQPVLAYRKLYVEEGHTHNATNLKQLAEWMPKVGYNVLVVPTDYSGRGQVKWDNWRKELTPELQKRGITIEVGGHGYQNFMNAQMENGALFKNHPEYFGMDAKGQRSPSKNRVFCTSNPEAVDYLTKKFVQYVKDRPEIQIYDFWPPDGAHWCECEKCKALGTPSDRQALLVEHVKREAAKVRPDLRMEILAYHTSIFPPEHATLDPAIFLDYCPIGQQFDHQINDSTAKQNDEYVRGLKAWREKFKGDISIYSYYRKYAWNSLPVNFPHYMQRDIEWYASVPVQGISSYGEPGDWQSYELQLYSLAALAWDPKTDVDELRGRFLSARYPGNVELAKSAYAMLEEIPRQYCSLPGNSLKSHAEFDLPREKIEQMKEKLEGAGLAKLAAMFEYVDRDLEIQQLRLLHSYSTRIREKVKSLHDFLESHKGEGLFVLERIPEDRLEKHYLSGE